VDEGYEPDWTRSGAPELGMRSRARKKNELRTLGEEEQPCQELGSATEQQQHNESAGNNIKKGLLQIPFDKTYGPRSPTEQQGRRRVQILFDKTYGSARVGEECSYWCLALYMASK
jgi:hypothetical protein